MSSIQFGIGAFRRKNLPVQAKDINIHAFLCYYTYSELIHDITYNVNALISTKYRVIKRKVT